MSANGHAAHRRRASAAIFVLVSVALAAGCQWISSVDDLTFATDGGPAADGQTEAAVDSSIADATLDSGGKTEGGATTDGSSDAAVDAFVDAGPVFQEFTGTISDPFNITTGPDGALWFTAQGSNAIGWYMPATGQSKSFPLSMFSAGGITVGSDHAIWFTESGRAKIGRLELDGGYSELPAGNLAAPGLNIATGPDGNVWFTEDTDAIGCLTPTGGLTEYGNESGLSMGAGLGTITAGPDQAMWFTEEQLGKIGRIATSNGQVTEYQLGMSGDPAHPQPAVIALGPDGNLWFTDNAPSAPAVGRIFPGDGGLVEYPFADGVVPLGITAGPANSLWVTRQALSAVLQVQNLNDGGGNEFYAPSSMSLRPTQITVGPDGALWFTSQSFNGSPNAIVRFVP